MSGGVIEFHAGSVAGRFGAVNHISGIIEIRGFSLWFLVMAGRRSRPSTSALPERLKGMPGTKPGHDDHAPA
jgi:hypothetical protein